MNERPTVALVTGGSRGIGRALVEALMDRGSHVYFCSRRAESVTATVAELEGSPRGRAFGRAADVRDEQQVQELVEWVVDSEDRLDLVVNNAGVGGFGAVDEIGVDEWRRTIETNLFGPFYVLREVAPIMRRQGDGWIVNIGSLAGKHAFAGGAAYNASKFGLVGLSEAAMLDLRHDGVRVTTVLPGSVATEFHTRRDPDPSWMLAPEDVARTVIDLLDYPDRALPSLIEIRPGRPPKKG